MAICANDAKQRGMLRKNTIVATVMSNLGLELGMNKLGINVIKTNVGDRYVLEKMLSDDYNFGGEQSGHIIFLDYNSTGDGILTGLQLLSVMKRNNVRISNLAGIVDILPQVIVNAKIKSENRELFASDEEIADSIAALEKEMQGHGRVLVRPSGTEPMIRVMLEGQDRKDIEQKAVTLAKLIESKLN